MTWTLAGLHCLPLSPLCYPRIRPLIARHLPPSHFTPLWPHVCGRVFTAFLWPFFPAIVELWYRRIVFMTFFWHNGLCVLLYYRLVSLVNSNWFLFSAFAGRAVLRAFPLLSSGRRLGGLRSVVAYIEGGRKGGSVCVSECPWRSQRKEAFVLSLQSLQQARFVAALFFMWSFAATAV